MLTMKRLQHFIGAAMIVAGLTTIYLAGQLADPLGGAAGLAAAGAVVVIVGYCIQGWHTRRTPEPSGVVAVHAVGKDHS